MGEGFGIPIIESQACGTPVITSKWTSMPELTINGYSTEIAQRWWTPLSSWGCIPSIDNILEALEKIYAWADDERRDRSEYGIYHMKAHYDWDVVVRDGWAPFLERVEREIKGAAASEAV
jgi:glycosyltransferase involved in cell wall biosynthesis